MSSVNEQPNHRESSGGGHGIRGEYGEEWTVFWITAHSLNATKFEGLGLSVSE
ncbi:MAG: hypothetical protein ISS70_08440 [Phycisphaerae bacterium]|nr:hypothetical protein [Phycisphaerae bacterium]